MTKPLLIIGMWYDYSIEMEHQNQASTQTEVKTPADKQPNPARKWLLVSLFGVFLCLGALSYHFIAGGSSSTDPLPVAVLHQVFGFTPYYFTENMPPNRLKLQKSSTKFFGNALTFDIANSKNQKITISQKALATDYKRATDSTDMGFVAPAGNATIKAIKSGRITALVTTKDNTLITLDSSDILNTETLRSVIEKLVIVDKQTGIPASPAQ